MMNVLLQDIMNSLKKAVINTIKPIGNKQYLELFKSSTYTIIKCGIIFKMSHPTKDQPITSTGKQFTRINSEELPTLSGAYNRNLGQPKGIKIRNMISGINGSKFTSQEFLIKQSTPIKQLDNDNFRKSKLSQPPKESFPQNQNYQTMTIPEIIRLIENAYSEHFHSLYLVEPKPKSPQALLSHIFRQLSYKINVEYSQHSSSAIQYEKQFNRNLKERIQSLQQQLQQNRLKQRNIEKMLAKSQQELFKYKSENEDLRMKYLLLKKQKQKNERKREMQIQKQRKRYENGILVLKKQMNQISQLREKSLKENWELSSWNQELQMHLQNTRKQFQQQNLYVSKSEHNFCNQNNDFIGMDRMDRTQGASTISYNPERFRNNARRPGSSISRSNRKSKNHSEIGDDLSEKERIQKEISVLKQNQSTLLTLIQQRDVQLEQREMLIEQLHKTIQTIKQSLPEETEAHENKIEA